MDDPDLDPSQTRNTRHFTVLPVPKSILQPCSTVYLVGLHRMFGDLKHLLVFYRHTFTSMPMLLQSAGVLFLLPLLHICFHPWRSVASPPISSSSYALYKHGAENSSITSCLQTLTPPHPLEPRFAVVLIGTRWRIPGEQMARGENVKFNLRGSASFTFLALCGEKCEDEMD